MPNYEARVYLYGVLQFNNLFPGPSSLNNNAKQRQLRLINSKRDSSKQRICSAI